MIEEKEDIWFEYNITHTTEHPTAADNLDGDNDDQDDAESNPLSDDEYEELQWGEIDNQSEEENSDEEQGAEAGDDQLGEAQGNEREEEHARNEHGEELDLVGAVGLDLEPPLNPVHLQRPKFPTRGQFIKFKRQLGSWLQEDFHVPTNRFTLAQVTARLKPDKHGRVYFNIRFQDGSEGGIYLARGDITINEFIWDIIEEADIEQHLPQLDGEAGRSLNKHGTTHQNELQRMRLSYGRTHH